MLVNQKTLNVHCTMVPLISVSKRFAIVCATDYFTVSIITTALSFMGIQNRNYHIIDNNRDMDAHVLKNSSSLYPHVLINDRDRQFTARYPPYQLDLAGLPSSSSTPSGRGHSFSVTTYKMQKISHQQRAH
jgi:hypothetical protein